MKAKPFLFSLSKNIDSLLAAIAGFLLIQLFAKHSGIGISPDSVTYLSAARHIVSGMGFLSFDNMPVVDFPFAYPFLLSVISFFTKLDPLIFAPCLNGILFGMLLYLSGGIMNGFTGSSTWYKRVLLCCILLSPALQELYSMLWSETIFILLILFFLISFLKYNAAGRTGLLMLPAGICMLACLTRYAGVFLVPAGTLFILVNQNLVRRKKILHIMIFCSVSLSMFGINLFRNYLLAGLPMGLRPGNDAGWLNILENFGEVLCDWLQIGSRPPFGFCLTLAVILILMLHAVTSFRRKRSRNGMEWMIPVTGLFYCIFMLLTAKLTRYETFTNRLLSPLFIPLLWSSTSWIPDCISRVSNRLQWMAGLSALCFSAWFLNGELRADYEYYDGVKDAGVPGYREDPFVQSEIVRFVMQNKSGFDNKFPIYSNAGEAVYFITGLPAHQLPYSAFPKRVQRYYQGKNSYLVWFNDLENPEMPLLDSIRANKKLILLKQVPDGAVYFSK